jgi:uncharacterized protein YlxW (UPF0749 family)
VAKPPPRRRVRTAAVLVPVTALGAGLLFATSASTAQGTDLRADRRLRLTELIARERDDVERRELRAEQLRDRVDAAAAAAAARDDRVAAATPGRALERGAALVAVTGPGVTVSLDDAPRRPGRPSLSADPDDLVVHEQDVQAVVNALWAGGAEAMTLMGQRIASTTAVRCVGNTVIVHGQVYSPPFVVEALGDPGALRASLDADPGVAFFRTFVERFGLGYDVAIGDELRLPAYEGPLELPHVAEPA